MDDRLNAVRRGSDTNPTRRPRAAIYARVSTTRQAREGTSLDEQVDRCSAWAAAQAMQVIATYREEGVSGAKGSRPELNRLMSSARSGDIDAIVVFALDRWGRSMRDLLVTLDELDTLGVAFASVRESIDSSTATGRLMRNIIGSLAEYERELIRDRMRSGVDAAVRAGGWSGGPPPYGYRVVQLDSERHPRLVVNDAEADVIRLIVRLFVDDGHSTIETAQELNARGISPPRAKRWTGANLRRWLLRANGWDGQYVYRRPREGLEFAGPPIVVEVPAILPTERVDALRARLAATASSSGSNAQKVDYLLSGRLRFRCGGRAYGRRRKDRGTRHYICARALHYQANNERCDCHRVDADLVEETVWAHVSSLLRQPERVNALAHKALGLSEQSSEHQTEDLAAIDRRIARLEKSLGATMADLLRQGMDANAVQAATAELEAELARLREHRRLAAAWGEVNRDRTQRARQIQQFADRAIEVISNPTQDTRHRVIDLLDVDVQIVDWRACTYCDGKGMVPKPVHRLPGKRGNQVDPCPECRRYRRIPQLEISGVIPLQDLGEQRADEGRDGVEVPFRLVPDAG